MPVIGSRLFPFSAGVVVGAVAHAAYPKLKEKYGAQVKETLAPVVAAALTGASDAVGQAARAASERVADLQETMAEAARRTTTTPSS
jgi:hypothetical protein